MVIKKCVGLKGKPRMTCNKVESFKKQLKPNKYYLADIKRNVYDPSPFDTENRAIKANLVVQISSGNDFIVPFKGSDLKKWKFKAGKIDIYQPVE